MSDQTEAGELSWQFHLDHRGDAYVAVVRDLRHAEPIVSVRIPRGIVDRTVLGAAGLTLDLRCDGIVAVYAEAIDLGNLTSTPLGQLVRETLDLVAPEDAIDELASLETALVQALALVRQERERRTPSP